MGWAGKPSPQLVDSQGSSSPSIWCFPLIAQYFKDFNSFSARHSTPVRLTELCLQTAANMPTSIQSGYNASKQCQSSCVIALKLSNIKAMPWSEHISTFHRSLVWIRIIYSQESNNYILHEGNWSRGREEANEVNWFEKFLQSRESLDNHTQIHFRSPEWSVAESTDSGLCFPANCDRCGGGGGRLHSYEFLFKEEWEILCFRQGFHMPRDDGSSCGDICCRIFRF